VAVFGAHWDLVGVIQAATTGVSLVSGRRFRWEAHPLAEEIVREQAIGLLPEEARPGVRRSLLGERDPPELHPGGRALVELLSNRDPRRTFELARRLPPETVGFLRRFSPASVAGRISAPVVAIHSTDDPTTPYGEVARLARGLPEARVVTVRGFRHVDFRVPSGWASAASDLWHAWRFVTWVLQAQE
jgi:pimeloyl-ACP methyl ester carboxylesterase